MSVQFCDYITLVPMGALIFFRIAYLLGWGIISYILLRESFPTKVRSLAASVSFSMLLFTNSLLVLLFPFLEQLMASHYIFLISMLSNISTCLSVLLFVPKTKGLTMKEIEDLFIGKYVHDTAP